MKKENHLMQSIEDLFELANVAFAVEIALAVARKNTSEIQIKNKHDLYRALTDGETLYKILKQALEYILSDNDIFQDTSRVRELYERDNRDEIADYFMTIKDKVKLEELRFY